MIKRLLVTGALLLSIIGGGYYFLSPQELNVGAELPGAPALFETSLASPITATANSFTLTSNSVRGGGTLSGYNCFTIDEGSAQAEFVCGTASGTAVTNVTRGISPSDGTSAVSALQFSHRRGASVKITDFPIIQLLRNQNNGEATFENVLRYAGTVVPSGASDLADVGYVLSVVNGGTVNFDALVVAGTAGESLSTSTLVYFKSSDQRWWKVDTDDTATFTGVALGMTRGAGTAGVAVTNGGILLKGLHSTSTLVAGATYYASSSAGVFNTATSALPIGVAKSATELYFDPIMLGVARLGFNNTFTGTNTFTGEALEVGTVSMIAGETINGATLPVPVYASSTDGEVYAMDANASNTQNFVGFAVTNSTNGNSIIIQTKGVVDGFSGLTANKQYYVQDTAGIIGSSIGTLQMTVGKAISTTEILIAGGKRTATGNGVELGTASGSLLVVTGFRPTTINIHARNVSDSAGNAVAHSILDLTWTNAIAKGVAMYFDEGSTNFGVSNELNLYGSAPVNYMTFSITSVTDVGFTISWTESGSFTTDENDLFYWEAEGEM